MKASLIGCILSACGLVVASSLPSVANHVVPNAVSSTVSPSASGLIMAQADGDVVDVASGNGSFTTFLSLLNALGLEEDLRGYGRFTVFAPTDAAFAALSPTLLTALTDEANRELAAQVLAYHVIVSGMPLYADDITEPMSLRTLERSDLEVRPDGKMVLVNGVEVMMADLEATNGVIHGIDQVLIPPSVAGQLP